MINMEKRELEMEEAQHLKALVIYLIYLEWAAEEEAPEEDVKEKKKGKLF